MPFQIDGIYAAYMAGEQGYGLALLLFLNGRIAGADLGGAIYEGSYKILGDGTLKGNVKVMLPPGQESILSTKNFAEINSDLNIALPITEEKVIRINTSAGPINVKLKKLSNIEA